MVRYGKLALDEIGALLSQADTLDAACQKARHQVGLMEAEARDDKRDLRQQGGELLRVLRVNLNRTQDELAADLGVSGCLLSLIETGHRLPSFALLRQALRLGASLGITDESQAG